MEDKAERVAARRALVAPEGPLTQKLTVVENLIASAPSARACSLDGLEPTGQSSAFCCKTRRCSGTGTGVCYLHSYWCNRPSRFQQNVFQMGLLGA